MPRLEVELAFVLGKPLQGPNCTIFDVLSATEYVTPAVEIIDARIQQVDPETKATRKVFDTISDNAAGAALVCGGRPFRPTGCRPALGFRGLLSQWRDRRVGRGRGGAQSSRQRRGLARQQICGRTTSALRPGEVILGGSFTRPVPARRGDTFHIDYGPFGCISCHFE